MDFHLGLLFSLKSLQACIVHVKADQSQGNNRFKMLHSFSSPSLKKSVIHIWKILRWLPSINKWWVLFFFFFPSHFLKIWQWVSITPSISPSEILRINFFMFGGSFFINSGQK